MIERTESDGLVAGALLDACRQYRRAVCDDREPDPLSCDALERALASSRIAYARDLVLAEAHKAGI